MARHTPGNEKESKMPIFSKGTVVRLVKDSFDSLPIRYMGRKGIVVRKAKSYEMSGSEEGYAVSFKGRKEPLFLWSEEMEVV